jgi:Domain of unknown function (DUF6285)
MPDRPTALELLEAVRGFLETEVAKGASDPRLRFRALVAANALSIAGRELVPDEASAAAEARILRELLGEPPSGASPAEEARALSLQLCGRIRAGTAPRETAGAVRRIVEGKLAAASPRYLTGKR